MVYVPRPVVRWLPQPAEQVSYPAAGCGRSGLGQEQGEWTSWADPRTVLVLALGLAGGLAVYWAWSSAKKAGEVREWSEFGSELEGRLEEQLVQCDAAISELESDFQRIRDEREELEREHRSEVVVLQQDLQKAIAQRDHNSRLVHGERAKRTDEVAQCDLHVKRLMKLLESEGTRQRELEGALRGRLREVEGELERERARQRKLEGALEGERAKARVQEAKRRVDVLEASRGRLVPLGKERRVSKFARSAAGSSPQRGG